MSVHAGRYGGRHGCLKVDHMFRQTSQRLLVRVSAASAADRDTEQPTACPLDEALIHLGAALPLCLSDNTYLIILTREEMRNQLQNLFMLLVWSRPCRLYRAISASPGYPRRPGTSSRAADTSRSASA